MSVARDIAAARELLEAAERETNPELKAQSLEEALAVLGSLDPDEVSDAQRQLVANLRLAHTRRLLAQLIDLSSVSMDAWFDYIDLLLGELSAEVARVTASDPHLEANYARFIELLGPGVAEHLRKRRAS
jgi:hypothetical protein